MKIVIVGAGEIGRAIAHYFLRQKTTTKLTLVDIDKKQLALCFNKLSQYSDTANLTINHFDDIEKIISASDLIFAAIPWTAHSHLIDLVTAHNKPLISVSRPTYSEIDSLQKKLEKMKSPIIFGCGLEPGLTEILARHCAKLFDRLDQLHIKCGGITKIPTNTTLRYKALFGTHYLPIAMRNAYAVVDSNLIQLPRFSGVEKLVIPSIGQLEAWHDGMVPWLYDYPEISSAHTITQKTLRWPGFSETVNTLNHLGLLSEKEIKLDNFSISPKKFIEYLYDEETTLQNEENITLLQVIGHGLIKSQKNFIELTLSVSNQDDTGLNSLSLLTGFTAAIIGSFILEGHIKSSGLTMPECIIQGKQLTHLIQLLNNNSVEFNIKKEIESYAL